MVPNAWLTKKGCFFGHLNLIITFSMHSMHIPESFIPMNCWWSIGDQNCHSLGYGVEPSSCFYEKVHRVKLKYGSNHLAKNWGKRWIVLHRSFVYCQTHLGLSMSLLLPVSPWRRCHGPCWKSKLIQPHIQCKSLQYFNCASFSYIHVVHWFHCSLHSFLEKKRNLIIVIKKKKTCFTMPLPNSC